jgi:hypothetical protein
MLHCTSYAALHNSGRGQVVAGPLVARWLSVRARPTSPWPQRYPCVQRIGPEPRTPNKEKPAKRRALKGEAHVGAERGLEAQNALPCLWFRIRTNFFQRERQHAGEPQTVNWPKKIPARPPRTGRDSEGAEAQQSVLQRHVKYSGDAGASLTYVTQARRCQGTPSQPTNIQSCSRIKAT